MRLNNGIDDQRIAILQKYLSALPILSTAWVFGSVVRGTARANSDIDIAVMFHEKCSDTERFDSRLKLMNDLSALVNYDVDVIDIEATPLFLQHQVRKGGILIVDKERKRRIEFDVRSRREYFDMKPTIDRRTSALLARCKKGGLSHG